MPFDGTSGRFASHRDRTVLVVADDLAHAEGAVDAVLVRQGGAGVDFHLVSVQPALGANVMRYVDRAAVRRFQHDEAHARIDGLRRALRAQGVRCTGHVAIGDAPACIGTLAGALGADEVIIAARRAGLLGRLLFDLWSRRIARASDVPVTLLPSRPGAPAWRPSLGWGAAT